MKNFLIIICLFIICVFLFYIWAAIQVGNATRSVAFAWQKSLEKRENPITFFDSTFMYSKDSIISIIENDSISITNIQMNDSVVIIILHKTSPN